MTSSVLWRRRTSGLLAGLAAALVVGLLLDPRAVDRAPARPKPA